MTNKNNNQNRKFMEMGIPISSIGFGTFGFLIILFSFITWFPEDLQRFFMGIIGGSLIGFLGYFIYKNRKDNIGRDENYKNLKEKIEELEKDIKMINEKSDRLEEVVIKLKNK